MTFEHIKDLFVLLLPPLSALGGVWLASHFNSRSEDRKLISKEIMLKKLHHYEQLYSLMQQADEVASSLFAQAKLARTKKSLAEIPDEVFLAGLRVAKYTDDNKLYLDEDVTIHVIATFLSPSSIYTLNPKSKKYLQEVKKLAGDYRHQYNTGVELIEDYVGLKRLHKAYKKINHPKTKSDIIDYARAVRKKYRL